MKSFFEKLKINRNIININIINNFVLKRAANIQSKNIASVRGPAAIFGAAIILTVILIVCGAADPAEAAAAFFLRPWSSPWFLGNTLDYTGLLLASSLGAAIAFRGGTFNLGGEGQIYLGGLASSVVLLSVKPGVNSAAVLCLAAAAGMGAGACMGFVPGLLKKKSGANELITSFLLSAALSPLADYLIEGPWREQGGNLLALPPFAADRLLPRILSPSVLSVSIFAAVFLAGAAHVFINRTVWGYRFRISGAAPDFARYGGIDPAKAWVPAMTVSGALSGLAGFFAVAGTYGRCHLGFPGGLGWNAIAVALIAGNRPAALFPAALIYGWLTAGSNAALLTAGLKLDTSAFIQALVLVMATTRFAPAVRSAPRKNMSAEKKLREKGGS